MNINYDHLFVDHLDQPVQLDENVTYRITESQVSANYAFDPLTGKKSGSVEYVLVHRVVALP